MDGNRLIGLVALGEIIALQHAGHGITSCQLQHASGTQFIEPGRIEHNLGLFRFEYLEHLRGIGFGIFLHLRFRQGRARHAFTGGITDHAGKVADQEQDMVPQILKLAQLVQ